MTIFNMTRCVCLTTLVALGATTGWMHVSYAQERLPTGTHHEGVEVLTRGPLHEAFAGTIKFDPDPGIVVTQAPPEAIEELAPDQRPEGANVAWIPGYWGWDDERNDFLWVSGIWRALPPGRQWLPGYWGQTQQGHQWTSGYWADGALSEVEYLPEPPATVEDGPNIAAPSADHTWIPGSWIWTQNRYAWRPGYWAEGQADWDWVPDHYVWTPSGYVFVDGYYDYSVSRRGVVFAPIYVGDRLRSQRGFTHSPSIVINPAVFGSHLFLRPSYGHYYFGDYYGRNYANAGYSPWFAYESSRRGYDPFYATQRWHNRGDREWEQRIASSFRNLRDNENIRPPRTWADQRARGSREITRHEQRLDVAESFDQVFRDNKTDRRMRFRAVDPAERQLFGNRGQEHRKYLQQRQQMEAEGTLSRGRASDAVVEPIRREFSRSPFSAPSADQLGRGNRPPQRHQVLRPDLQVEPQPIQRGNRSQPRGDSNSQRAREGAGQLGDQLDRGSLQQPRQSGNRGRGQSESAQQSSNDQGSNRRGTAAEQPQGDQRSNRGRSREGTSAEQSRGEQNSARGRSQQNESSGRQQGGSENKPAEKAEE
jgi:hypothetical protein